MKDVEETGRRRLKKARRVDHVSGIIDVSGDSVLVLVVEVLFCGGDAI